MYARIIAAAIAPKGGTSGVIAARMAAAVTGLLNPSTSAELRVK